MAPKPIVVKITGDADDLKKAAKDAGDSLDKLGRKADSAGDSTTGFGGKVGGVARDKLGPLGDAADQTGIDLDNMGAGALVAGAAIVGVGAFAAQGVTKFVDLADSVREFQTVSGATWEDSSRLVAVADDLGVSADTAAASMGRLAKNIDTGKLAEFGIEVVRTKDGTVDMAATLGNVADAMNRTVDPARKAAMGTALFGKSWADMAPILSQGSAGIRDMMASVSEGQIVTEENSVAARDWALALDDAQDAVTDLQMTIGKEMLPTLTLLAKDFAKVSGAVSDLSGRQLGLNKFQEVFSPIAGIYNARLGQQAEAAQKAALSQGELSSGVGVTAGALWTAAHASTVLENREQALAAVTQILTARQKDAAEAAKEAGDQVKIQAGNVAALRDQVMTIVGSQLAFEAAQRDSTAAAVDLTTKTAELQKARDTYGEGTPEAIKAQDEYALSIAGSKEQAHKMALAEVDIARERAIASGVTFDAEQKNIVYRDSLSKIRDATTDTALLGGLDDLIGRVDQVAAMAGTAAQNLNAAEAAARRLAAVAAGAISVSSSGEIQTTADAAERRLAGRAHGGPVTAGRPYLVGERGPELFAPAQSGTVLNNQQTGQALAGGGTTIVINSPIGRPDDVVAWMREQLRRSERARR